MKTVTPPPVTWNRIELWLALSILTAVLTSPFLPAQSSETPQATLVIPRTDRAPTLDDFLEMKPSAEMEGKMAKAAGFIQQIPSDGQPSAERTEVYVSYDDRHLYVVFVAFDSEPDKVRAHMARREAISDLDDWVEVALDTYQDQRRGYLFDCNPLGVQWDALYSEAEGEDSSFDTLWFSRGQVTARGYLVWMAIPFKSLRFSPQEGKSWGLIFTRWIARIPEKSTWPHVSSRIQGRFNQAGAMSGLEDISPGRNFQLIPYGVFRTFKTIDDLDPNAPRFTGVETEIDGGLDSKFVLKENLVLDVALNPDFSQVESDEPQVTVNRRFEVFFPEKRPFFIENASYFRTPINLLFTRRIADPLFGVRMTGKTGPYSLGVLFADDQAPGEEVLPSDPLYGQRAWFGVVRINRDILKQSTVGVFFSDRELDSSFNRVFGVDGRFKLSRNWVASLQAVTSETRNLDGSRQSGPAYEVEIERSGRQFDYEFQFRDRSPGFLTQAGFVPRTDIREFQQEIRYRWRPEGDFLIAWGPEVDSELVYDHSGTRLDWIHDVSLEWEFSGQTEFTIFYEFGRERLRPQDFSGLPEGRDFPRDTRGFAFDSNFFRWLSLDLAMTWEKVINFEPAEGELPSSANSKGTFLSLTFRPVTPLRIDNTFIIERLRDPVTNDPIFNNSIFRSKWSYQFNRELSARAIFQYDRVQPNETFTELENTKNFNLDLLLTYLINPWTALYVGYNSNHQNLAIIDTPTGSKIVRTDDLLNDSRGFFVKFSYLFRF